MKLAIVHDYLNQFGGAERVIMALHEVFPDAPIYTSIYDENKLPVEFRKMDIRVSFMQKFPFIFKLFKFYLLFYPLAFESFDLSNYDVILSSSSAFAKGVKKKPGQKHVCYCYTPTRFVWRYNDYVKREGFGPILRRILELILEPIKKWDLIAVRGVDHFIAISKTIQNRIQRVYGRKSSLIYPPVDTHRYGISSVDKDYFLVVSRLNPYKRIDLVVEAFNDLGLPLKIIGTGPDLKKLQKIAKDNIEFLGRQSEPALVKCYSECRAFIFPGEEDFGIAPVEAMAAGRPVIAYRAGGARETIVPGKTGVFFKEQSVAALVEAVNKFQFAVFNKEAIRAQALKFSKKIFQDKIKSFVEEKGKE